MRDCADRCRCVVADRRDKGYSMVKYVLTRARDLVDRYAGGVINASRQMANAMANGPKPRSKSH